MQGSHGKGWTCATSGQPLPAAASMAGRACKGIIWHVQLVGSHAIRCLTAPLLPSLLPCQGLELVRLFFSLLPQRQAWGEASAQPAEFLIDETFGVPGVGTVVAGTVRGPLLVCGARACRSRAALAWLPYTACRTNVLLLPLLPLPPPAGEARRDHAQHPPAAGPRPRGRLLPAGCCEEHPLQAPARGQGACGGSTPRLSTCPYFLFPHPLRALHCASSATPPFPPQLSQPTRCARCPAQVVAGQTASLALKKVRRSAVRKGMVLVDEAAAPRASWEFDAEIAVLTHATTIQPRYQVCARVCARAYVVGRRGAGDAIGLGLLGVEWRGS